MGRPGNPDTGCGRLHSADVDSGPAGAAGVQDMSGSCENVPNTMITNRSEGVNGSCIAGGFFLGM
jgi:hypothetical protein